MNKDNNKNPKWPANAAQRQNDLRLGAPKGRSRPKLESGPLSELIRDLLSPLMARWLAERYGLTSESVNSGKPKPSKFKTTKKVQDNAS
jgi:hypothetical protein